MANEPKFWGMLSRRNAAFIFLASLIIFVAISIIAWRITRNLTDTQSKQEFDSEVNQINSLIDSEIILQADHIYNIAGLFASASRISRSQWADYFKTSQLTQRDPTIISANFAQRVSAAGKAAFIRDIKNDTSVDPDGYPQFKIFPDSDKADYYVNIYREPAAGGEAARGYDLSSDPTRLAAINKAIETGLPTKSGVISSIVTGEKAFLIIMPVYQMGLPLDTASERHIAAKGVVYLVFRVNNFFRSLFPASAIYKGFDFEIYDTTDRGVSGEDLLYDSDNSGQAIFSTSTPAFSTLKVIEVAGRKWTIYYSSGPSWQGYHNSWINVVIFLSVFVLGFLISLILYFLSSSRQHAIELANKMTTQLQSSEKQYRDLVESAPYPLIIQTEGKFDFLNKAAVNLYGASRPEELLGKPVLSIVHPDFREIVEKRIEAEIEENMPAPLIEIKLLKINGQEFYAEAAAGPIIWNGKRGTQTVFHDITDRKTAEGELVKKNKELRELNEIMLGRELKMAELKKEIEKITKNK